MSEKNANLVDKRATGLLIIEVRNSNPNGDPDRESDPRQRQDGRGEISPVSFKRKLRDLIEDKQCPVWIDIKTKKNLVENRFYILEQRGRKREDIKKELANGGEVFKDKYWDGRLFGNTFLEEGGSTTIKTGVVQFGLGVSMSPVDIERLTNTSKSGVEEGKDRGMAPLAYRIVKHGVYCIPFFVNPTAAQKTGCVQEDIDVMLHLIPYAYPHTASYIRPYVEIRHAWYMEHKSALGSCSDFALIDALTPKRKGETDERRKENTEKPSTSWDDYDVPKELPKELRERLNNFKDLMNEQ
ncbi:MAG: type I CRISPR-associated protein Cas7 [Deltaproteobacteria bacterium]|nr:type I CRISPR-associated protein Cas7 [Deltaproteobacteria bacterium]